LPFVQRIDRDGNSISLLTKDDTDYREAVGRFVLEKRLILLEMKKAEKNLEEAFVTITENNLAHLASKGKE